MWVIGSGKILRVGVSCGAERVVWSVKHGFMTFCDRGHTVTLQKKEGDVKFVNLALGKHKINGLKTV